MILKREYNCVLKDYVDGSKFLQREQLYSAAASNDGATIKAWYQTWIDNIKANKLTLGSFKEFGVGELFGKYKHGTVLLAGSGPSLQYNVAELKNRGSIPLISCLHNFHYMEDNDARPEFYVSLDAGPVVLEEVCEGGLRTVDEYWELTKDRSLVAFIGSNPELLKKWQGKIYVFNAPIPDLNFIEEVNKVEVFSTMISNGGNVLGACLYLAKGIMGCHRVAFLGADFSFGVDRKSFHPWPSKYDISLGYVIPMTDIFGHCVASWPSYANFKSWFDYLSLTIPGNWMINCSEGGCLGSYPQGNIQTILQLPLADFIKQMNISDTIRDQCIKPEVFEKKILF